MSNAISKELEKKVQVHIKNMTKGEGGLKSLFDQIEYIDKAHPYHAVYELVMSDGFLTHDIHIVKQLKEWGFNDEKWLWNYRTWNLNSGPKYLYAHLIATTAEKLYRQYRKKKAAPRKKVVKKARTVTKKVPMTFGMVEQTRAARRD